MSLILHCMFIRAIMSYHSNKMEQINKIIEHLWSKIYKGGG